MALETKGLKLVSLALLHTLSEILDGGDLQLVP